MTDQSTQFDHIPETFTVESLQADGFTDQEIAALSEGDDAIVDAATTPETTANEETDALQVPAPQEAEATTETPPIETTPAPEDVPATPKAEEAPPAPEPVPLPELPDVTAHEATVAESDTALDNLLTQYDDGEITGEELRTQQKAIIAEQAKAQAAIEQANLLQTQAQEIATTNQQTQAEHFYSRVNAYKEAVPAIFSDEHINGWDAHVQAVTGNPIFADMTVDQQLRLAQDQYAAEYKVRHGKELDFGTPAPEATTEDKLQVKTEPRPDGVQTLAGVNSASAEALTDSTFAAIDKKMAEDPLAAEALIDQLEQKDPEAYERFLEGR